MKNNRQTGRVNYIWVLAGGYLLYLAVQILRTMFAGDAGSPIVAVLGAGTFIVVGTLLLLREWRAYQYGKAHIDDPETWTEEPAPEETMLEETVQDAAEDQPPEEEP